MNGKTMINDEIALWEGFHSGDTTCTELLLKKYSRLVRSCARSYFLAGGEMEDLLQEGMVALLAAMHSFSPERGASFASFASVCIRNRIIDTVKAYGNSQDALAHSLPVDLTDMDDEKQLSRLSVSDPEDLLIRSDEAERSLHRLQQSLTELETKILYDYLSGMSYREIAERCGKTPKSVDNSVQRIRKKMQAIINSSDNSES